MKDNETVKLVAEILKDFESDCDQEEIEDFAFYLLHKIETHLKVKNGRN